MAFSHLCFGAFHCTRCSLDCPPWDVPWLALKPPLGCGWKRHRTTCGFLVGTGCRQASSCRVENWGQLGSTVLLEHVTRRIRTRTTFVSLLVALGGQTRLWVSLALHRGLAGRGEGNGSFCFPARAGGSLGSAGTGS